jgi:hypothetical protein
VDFKITANTCGASLGPSSGCTVAIAFTPTASGTRSGTFSITDDVGTQTASLSGIGTSPATDALSPLALTFAPQQITTASTAQQITLTNSGDLPLTLIAAQITSGDFTVVNACGNSLNPHSTCSINVAFAPKNVGTLSGQLMVSDQYRPQTVALTGIGLAPPGVSLSPFSTVTFAATGVGIQAAAQTVTLTNNGDVPLLVQSVAIVGDFVILPGGNTCGSTVAVSTACTMQVAFAPTVGGPRSGSLTVTDNAPNSPQTLSLTGTGVDFTLDPNGGTSLTIANGQNAVYPLLLTSAANIPGTATFTCTGAPANSTCNITPSTVALGSTTTISVTVLTGVSSTGEVFTAADESAWYGLACCAIAVESCRVASNPTIVAGELGSAGLPCCCNRVWRRACNSFAEWFESKPYAHPHHAYGDVYDRCFGQQPWADAGGQPDPDRSLGFLFQQIFT